MVRIITVDDIKSLIRKLTLKNYFERLFEKIEKNFQDENTYKHYSRYAIEVNSGVSVMTPFFGTDYYAMNYTNYFPNALQPTLMNAVGLGILSDVMTGNPVLISEMTLVKALNRALIAALATKYLANKNAKSLAIIGNSREMVYLVLAHQTLLAINTVYYVESQNDIDFQSNWVSALTLAGIELHPSSNWQEAVKAADVVLLEPTDEQPPLSSASLKSGVLLQVIENTHFHHLPVTAEWLAQSRLIIEGQEEFATLKPAVATLAEIISGQKKGREQVSDNLVFYSGGLGLADYTSLKMIYSIAEDFHIGHMLDMVPEPKDYIDLCH